MDKLEQKVANYLDLYGIDGINLVIKRHDLANLKREYFSVRFMEQDAEKELELTKEMDKLSEEIQLIDNELEKIGITSKNRPNITKDIKKYSPSGWFLGFGKGF